MSKKVMFVYEFEKRTPSQVVQTNRKLFGYIDQSFHGKYIYRREGLLSHIDIQRISKGVLIADEEFHEEINETLHSMGTKKIKRYFLTVDKILG